MIYVNLSNDTVRPLSFYLAMEEYVAKHVYQDEDLFYMWRVTPTVICGRNQVIEDEVNLDYCRQHHINVFRRHSGGGCVYADMDNVMLSYVTKGDDVVVAFDRYMAMLVKAFNAIGIPAERNDHNDILIDGKKISGNALSHTGGMIMAHGTLLYDTDMENMSHAITPSKAKLSHNGVKSVQQRITFLKDHTTMPLLDIISGVKRNLCDKEITLSPADEQGIHELEMSDYRTDSLVFE